MKTTLIIRSSSILFSKIITDEKTDAKVIVVTSGILGDICDKLDVDEVINLNKEKHFGLFNLLAYLKK